MNFRKYEIVFILLSKIFLSLSPLFVLLLMPTGFVSSAFWSINIIYFISIFLSLSLFLKIRNTMAISSLVIIYIILFVISSVLFLISDNFIPNNNYHVIFGLESLLWGSSISPWSLPLIGSLFIFLIGLKEIGVFKKFFYYTSIITLLLNILNYIVFFKLQKDVLYLKYLTPTLFSFDSLLNPAFIIILLTFILFIFYNILNLKKIKLANIVSSKYKYLFLFSFFMFIFLLTYNFIQYLVYKKIENIIVDANKNSDVYIVDNKKINSLISDFEYYKNIYNNDTISILENKILEIDRKFILSKLLVRELSEEERRKLTRDYIDNLNEQLLNANYAINYNKNNYEYYIELGSVYEKMAIVMGVGNDFNIYDKAVESYQKAEAISPINTDFISVMKAKLWLNRLDKSAEDRKIGFEKYISEAFSKNNDSYDACIAMTLYYIKNQDFDKASEFIKILNEKFGENKDILELKNMIQNKGL